jgi:type I restriction enzyme S subunit
MTEWRETTLGDVLTLQRGFDLPARDRIDGPYPIVSSSGITGHHAVAKVEPPGVVIGRYGSLGSVHWVSEPYWPHNTALWVKDFKGNDPRFTSYLLRTISHDGSAAAAVPGVNRNHLHALSVRVPDVRLQRRIAAVLAAFDELIAINERRIELLEGLARSLYREWFVRFRFPGWDSVLFTDTSIGSAPADWQVDRLGKFVTTSTASRPPPPRSGSGRSSSGVWTSTSAHTLIGPKFRIARFPMSNSTGSCLTSATHA